LAEGKPYDEIARDLDVGRRTIVDVVYQLKRKLGVRTIAGLVRYYRTWPKFGTEVRSSDYAGIAATRRGFSVRFKS